MKPTKLSGILLLLLFITSCHKESIEPITLHYVENNSVDIIYPNTDNHSISIIGGDGKYSASCNNVSVIEAEIVQEKMMILLKPRSTGNAIVTITDESGNQYVLNVNVCYKEINLIIDKQDVIVVGNKLSEAQKAEIERKAILTLPVKVNGGFKLVYNNSEELNKGQVFIYNDNHGGEAAESVFEYKKIKLEVDGVIQTHPSFVITIDGKKRVFVVNRYFASKSSMVVPMAFNEDITELFKTEYPDVELIYTQQRFFYGSR